MSTSQRFRGRYVPDPRVVALVERFGAVRVGTMFGLDVDVMRRYLDGSSQRTTRWWIETHAERVERDMLAAPVLALVRRPTR